MKIFLLLVFIKEMCFLFVGDTDNSANNEGEEDIAKKDLVDDDSDNDSNSNSQSLKFTDVQVTPIANGTPFIVSIKCI